jgi:hypothetical protein
MTAPIILRTSEPNNTLIFKDEINNDEEVCYLTEIEMRFSYLLICNEENETRWEHPIYQELPFLLSRISLNLENKSHLLVMLTNQLWSQMEKNEKTDKLLRKRQMLLNSLMDSSLLTTISMKYKRIEDQINSLYYFTACMIILHNEKKGLCKKGLIDYLLYFLVNIDDFFVKKLHNDEYQTLSHIIKVRMHHLISNNIWDEFEKEISACVKKKGDVVVKIIKRLRKIYKI